MSAESAQAQKFRIFRKSSLWLSLVREQVDVQSQTGVLEGHLG